MVSEIRASVCFYCNCKVLFLDGDRVIIDNNMTSVFIAIVKSFC